MPSLIIQNQTELYYEVEGSSTPIIFIHPPGMGLVTFRLQKPLSERYQVITFDLRGNGRSRAGEEEVTIPLLANDILMLADKLSLDKFVLCGYSNGGSIALEFALSYPDRVAGLVLIGGFPEVNTYLLKSEFLLGIYTVKMKGIHILAKVLGQAHGTSKQYKKEIEEYVRKADSQILYQMYVKGLEYNCTNRLKEIEAPVLLVDGAFDLYMHSYQKLLEKELRDVKKVFIPKARHQIPTKYSKQLNQLIFEFMENIRS